jgi:hypothetical protein
VGEPLPSIQSRVPGIGCALAIPLSLPSRQELKPFSQSFDPMPLIFGL